MERLDIPPGALLTFVSTHVSLAPTGASAASASSSSAQTGHPVPEQSQPYPNTTHFRENGRDYDMYRKGKYMLPCDEVCSATLSRSGLDSAIVPEGAKKNHLAGGNGQTGHVSPFLFSRSEAGRSVSGPASTPSTRRPQGSGPWLWNWHMVNRYGRVRHSQSRAF